MAGASYIHAKPLAKGSRGFSTHIYQKPGRTPYERVRTVSRKLEELNSTRNEVRSICRAAGYSRACGSFANSFERGCGTRRNP